MKPHRFDGIAAAVAFVLAAAGPAAAQSVVSDQALERLATRESRLPQHLARAIFDDAAMRAEIKRVGLAKGCRAVADSRRVVADEFVPALVPATIAAIRKIVPEQRLVDTKIWSLVAGPLWIYADRIDNEISRTAPEILAAARSAMQRTFLKRTGQYPSTKVAADNILAPKADINAMVGLKGQYDLDNPAQIRLACAELLISPSERPVITTEPKHDYVIVPPAKK